MNLVVPSGSGQDALNITEGFGRLQPGQVSIDRLPVDGVQAGPIAFMFAGEILLPWRTAAANVEPAMEVHGGRPSSMPWIIARLRLGGPYAVSAAVVGAFVVASRGLGFPLAYQAAPLDTTGTRAARVLLSTLAAIVTVGVMVIEKRALKWRVAGGDGEGRDRGAVGGLC